VIDEHRQLSFVNFGEVLQSHLVAVDFIRRYAVVDVPRRFKAGAAVREQADQCAELMRPMLQGELAGLSPMAGLYASILPLVAYAMYTSSRQVMVGPDGTLAVLTATSVAPLAGGEPARYAALAAALALMVGVILLLSAALRLGFMAEFLSVPILVGYFNGIALIIIASQLGKVFGLSLSADYFFGLVREFITEIGQIHWLTAMFSFALLGLVLVLKRVAPTFPGSLGRNPPNEEHLIDRNERFGRRASVLLHSRCSDG